MSELTLPQALQRLADFRTTDRRASQETFDNGLVILKNNAHGKMGDDGESIMIHSHSLTRSKSK
jgi:hypothetical protein